MAKDIDIKVKVDGATEAAGQLDGVAKATETVGQATQQAADAAVESSNRWSTAQEDVLTGLQMQKEAAEGLAPALGEVGDKTIQAGQDQAEFSDYLKQSAQDAKDFKEYMDQAAASATNTGDAVQNATSQAGQGFDKAGQKASILDRILHSVQGSAFRMMAGFFGIQAIIRAFETWIERLKEIQSLQKEISDKALATANVGQSLEMGTGTTGKQQFWSLQALEMQRIGGLKSPEDAQALMLGIQGATKGVGGIQNPHVMAMAQRLAPRFGASGKSASDLEAILKAAAEEGVGPAGLEAYITKGLGVSAAQAAAYLQTPIAQSRADAAESQGRNISASPFYNGWSQRVQDAEDEFKRRKTLGQESYWIADDMEKVELAYASLQKEIDTAANSTEDTQSRDRLRRLSKKLNIVDPFQKSEPLWGRGEGIEREFRGITINHITNHNPIVGRDLFRDGRASPEQVAP